MKPSPALRLSDRLGRLSRSALTTALYTPVIRAAARVSAASAYRMLQGWSRDQLGIFDIDLDVFAEERLDPERSYVFVHLNQTSLLEAFLLPRVLDRPSRIVVNWEFACFPFAGPSVVAAGGIVIVRQWRAQATWMLGQAVEHLKRGESIAISIEGRRSPDGRLCRYRKGPVVLAIEAGVDLVPIYFEGARELWPYGEWAPAPGRVRANLLRPISVNGLTYADRDRVIEQLKSLAHERLGLPDRVSDGTGDRATTN